MNEGSLVHAEETLPEAATVRVFPNARSRWRPKS